MSYPNQLSTLLRLEQETRRAQRKHEDEMVGALKAFWNQTKSNMRGIIMLEYRHDHGGANWSLPRSLGTLERIHHHVGRELVKFHGAAVSLIRQSTKDAYRFEALRQVWMLDQLTPPSVRPVHPPKALREADRPEDYQTEWDTALAEWLQAYQTNLYTNLRLESLHEGSMTDAADEVDATKIDNFEPSYKFASLLSNQILPAQRQARADVADENDDLVAEEIFQDMEDDRVCPDCASQDGVEVDRLEIFGHIYGFNCRCFERIVPVEFAELLRNGNDEEKQAALDADARGLVPDAMVIKDPVTGKIKAHAQVDFGQWLSDEGLTIRGRAGSFQGEF